MPTKSNNKNQKHHPNQKQVWEAISKKWNQYKTIPSPSVIDFIKDKTGKILDLGCGSGRNFVKTKAKIYCVDFSEKMLKFAEKNAKAKNINAEFILANSDKLLFKENYFDSAICTALLHCIPSQEKRKKTIKEIYRVLKPGAEAFISVWSKNSPRLKNKPKQCYIPWTSANVEKRYVYIYDLKELEKEAEQADFEILKSWEQRNINIIVKKPV